VQVHNPNDIDCVCKSLNNLNILRYNEAGVIAGFFVLCKVMRNDIDQVSMTGNKIVLSMEKVAKNENNSYI
jgi:hypothetical protein